MNQRHVSVLVLTLAMGIAAGCNAAGSDDVASALEKHKREIIGFEHVTGVGLGTCNDAPCIKIYVERSDDRLADRLRTLLGETPHEIIISEKFRARPE